MPHVFNYDELAYLSEKRLKRRAASPSQEAGPTILPTIMGYCAVFGDARPYPWADGLESIRPGAFTWSPTANIPATIDHNPKAVAGSRGSASLVLHQDEIGLRIALHPQGPAGRQLADYIADGQVGMSWIGRVLGSHVEKGINVLDAIELQEVCFAVNQHPISPWCVAMKASCLRRMSAAYVEDSIVKSLIWAARRYAGVA